jgi:hypothetical protein
MSASQANILDFVNLRFGSLTQVRAGVGRHVQGVAKVVGFSGTSEMAQTNDAAVTLQAISVSNHQWAARVGKYNDNPIWEEIFENIERDRRRQKAELK